MGLGLPLGLLPQLFDHFLEGEATLPDDNLCCTVIANVVAASSALVPLPHPRWVQDNDDFAVRAGVGVGLEMAQRARR